MPNPTQSTAETKLYVPKKGERVIVSAYTRVYSSNPKIKAGDVLTFERDSGVQAGSDPALDGYRCILFEEHAQGAWCRVSPATAVSDLCDACGGPSFRTFNDMTLTVCKAFGEPISLCD